LAKGQTEADKNLRLGFGIANFEQTSPILKQLQVQFSLEPTRTEFGFMSIISDPDQRKVELYKK
jgi:lactoylglutathione lyase